MIQINQIIQDHLRSGSARPDWASAIETDKGVTYLKYDALRIGNLSDAQGGIAIQFMWRECQVAWERFPTAALVGDHYHHLKGVSGRVKIS